MSKGLAVVIVAASLLFSLGTIDPNVPRFTVLYGVAIGGLVWLAWKRELTLTKADPIAFVLFGWAAIAVYWSPDRWEGMSQFKGLAGLLALFLISERTDPKYIPSAVSWSIIGAMVLNSIFHSIYGGFGNPNFITEFVIIALPLALYNAFCFRISGIVASLWGMFFLVFEAQSNARFLALGVIVLALIWNRIPKWTTVSGVAFLAIGGIALPFFTTIDIAQSIKSRIEVFLNTGAMIWENPIFGGGTGSYNYNYNLYQEIHRSFVNWNKSVVADPVTYAGNAHNEILQVWAEQGLIGLALVGWLAYKIMQYKSNGLEGAAWWTILLGGALSMVGFPWHNGHTAAIMTVACGILSRDYTRVVKIRWLAFPALLVAGILSSFAVKNYQSQIKMAELRETLYADPLRGFKANVDAYNIYPYEQHTRRQMILSLTKVVQSYGPNLELDEAAADKVYRISQSAAKWSPATEISRIEYLINSGRWLGKESEIETALDNLKKIYRNNYITWTTEALWAARIGDGERVLFAADMVDKTEFTATAQTLARKFRAAVKEHPQ